MSKLFGCEEIVEDETTVSIKYFCHFADGRCDREFCDFDGRFVGWVQRGRGRMVFAGFVFHFELHLGIMGVTSLEVVFGIRSFEE